MSLIHLKLKKAPTIPVYTAHAQRHRICFHTNIPKQNKMTTGTRCIYVVLLLFAWLSMGSSCKDKEPVSPAPKNYFTCKINGMEYKPSGYNGTPNYGINVEPNYRDGVISIATYRYEGDDIAYSLGFGSDSLKRRPVNTPKAIQT
jgi:hypothetical protein